MTKLVLVAMGTLLVGAGCRAGDEPDRMSSQSEALAVCDYECWAGGSGYTGWPGCCGGPTCWRPGHCCEPIGIDPQAPGTIVQKQADGSCQVVGFGTLGAGPACPDGVCGFAINATSGCCDLNTGGGCTWQTGCNVLGVTRWCSSAISGTIATCLTCDQLSTGQLLMRPQTNDVCG